MWPTDLWSGQRRAKEDEEEIGVRSSGNQLRLVVELFEFLPVLDRSSSVVLLVVLSPRVMAAAAAAANTWGLKD